MSLSATELRHWITGEGHDRRYTQDSPVMPDVWMLYGEAPGKPADLLLTAHANADAAMLAGAVTRTVRLTPLHELAYNRAYVAVQLTLHELVQQVLPLSQWWQTELLPLVTKDGVRLDWNDEKGPAAGIGEPEPPAPRNTAPREPASPADAAPPVTDLAIIAYVAERLQRPVRDHGRHAMHRGEPSGNAVWFIGLVGRIELERQRDAQAATRAPGAPDKRPEPTAAEVAAAGWALVRDSELPADDQPPLLWSINRNRPVTPAVARSRITVKADAAVRLFRLSCRDLRWAVIDTGIDARHPAFQRRPPTEAASARGRPDAIDDSPATAATPDAMARRAPAAATSRVAETYDFTRLRALFSRSPDDRRIRTTKERDRQRLEQWLTNGLTIDWSVFEPFLRVPHDAHYEPPEHEHGTHVAGVLAADWQQADTAGTALELEQDVTGVCPDLELLDLRVMSRDGRGNEFAMLAALQYIRWRNANSTLSIIHGVNLSVSLIHDVGAFACGRTPVCDECERLIGGGTVVVAAAGNEGRARFTAADGLSESEGYRSVSITDPGNASGVITVGATHRDEPHNYGVSYFSSRGPTGDGRRKPDLVAPGEKITAPVPNLGLKTLDGTSQAAPHVSGAAALLMARHPELIGDPARVKAVLCETATDLAREPDFQGAGIVDVLRAIQAV